MMTWCSSPSKPHEPLSTVADCPLHGIPSAHLAQLAARGADPKLLASGYSRGRHVDPSPTDFSGAGLSPIAIHPNASGPRMSAMIHSGLRVSLTTRDAVHHGSGEAVGDPYFLVRVERPGDSSWRPRGVYTAVRMGRYEIDYLGLLDDACSVVASALDGDSVDVESRLSALDGVSEEKYRTVVSPAGSDFEKHHLPAVPGRRVAVDDESVGYKIVRFYDPVRDEAIEIGDGPSVESAYTAALCAHMGLCQLPLWVEQQAAEGL